ncbi:glutamine-hydrolyzing GMP synthase [archaeon]|nr:glutamine-hydrolyzing GMP synthase [archaeon]
MFDSDRFIQEKTTELANTKENTIIACSGGVDSTVTAILLHKALGKNLHCVFVDTGFMRKDEPETVKKIFNTLKVPLTIINAQTRFYEALKGITEPEQKRKIIGKLFIELFEEEAKKVNAKNLAQGTLAPDWIESGGQLRDTIKSHHNVGGLPEQMNLELIEPVRDLYKDEVRKIGLALGIPNEFCQKQPFPGPGLAVRIMGEATEKRAEIVRKACAIVEEELEKAAEEGKMTLPWQYFAVLIPIKSVGVQGDARAYGYTIAVRSVESVDAMTADYSKVPHEVLEKISVKITNTLKDKINRVVYDISNKPPSTIEWE